VSRYRCSVESRSNHNTPPAFPVFTTFRASISNDRDLSR
jgi:hypothetical protein